MHLNPIPIIKESASSALQYISDHCPKDLKKTAAAAASIASVLAASGAAYFYRNEIYDYFYPPQSWGDWAVSWITPTNSAAGTILFLVGLMYACSGGDDKMWAENRVLANGWQFEAWQALGTYHIRVSDPAAPKAQPSKTMINPNRSDNPLDEILPLVNFHEITAQAIYDKCSDPNISEIQLQVKK